MTDPADLAQKVRMGFRIYGYEQAQAALDELVWRLDQAERRCHHILQTIYDGTSYRDLDTIGQQAAKLRCIERLARLDWDDEGMSIGDTRKGGSDIALGGVREYDAPVRLVALAMSTVQVDGDAQSGHLTRQHDDDEAAAYVAAVAATPPAWWEVAYKGGPPVGPSEMPRPLYFPGNPSNKPPSDDGPDVLAVKRAVWRGGRWPGPASSFDDSFSKAFALGKGGNVIETGLAGFQRQMKIQPTGMMGDETYQALRYARVPESLPHAGEPLFDQTAVGLLGQAANPPPASASARAAALADYLRRCIQAEPKWHYAQERPIKPLGTPPNEGGTTDCSGHSTCAYYWAGAPDPNGRLYDGYGYTGTLIDNPKVLAPYQVGDLAIYGDSTSATEHVVTCYQAGNESTAMWCSHGSEGAPCSVKLLYRSDLLAVVRPGLV